jgi:hypothetical protein
VEVEVAALLVSARQALRYLKGDFTSIGLQLAVVTSRLGTHTARVALIWFWPAKLVGLLKRYWLRISSTNFFASTSRLYLTFAFINSDHFPKVARLAALA